MKNKHYDPELDKGFSGGLKGISKVVESFLKARPKMAEKFEDLSAPDLWAKVMDEHTVTRTQEVFYKNGMLYVKLSSPCLRNDLINRRSEVLASIREVMPKVKDIYWK